MTSILPSLLSLSCLFASVSFAQVPLSARHEDYVALSSVVVNEFVGEANKRFGVRCHATGGSMPHDIENFLVMLHSDKTVALTQARILQVELTELFLKIINSNARIRPFLRQNPVLPKQIEMVLSFKTEGKSGGELKQVIFTKAVIAYQAEDPNSPIKTTLHEETYEEAKRIVLQSKKENVKTQTQCSQGKKLQASKEENGIQAAHQGSSGDTCQGVEQSNIDYLRRKYGFHSPFSP